MIQTITVTDAVRTSRNCSTAFVTGGTVHDPEGGKAGGDHRAGGGFREGTETVRPQKTSYATFPVSKTMEMPSREILHRPSRYSRPSGRKIHGHNLRHLGDHRHRTRS